MSYTTTLFPSTTVFGSEIWDKNSRTAAVTSAAVEGIEGLGGRSDGEAEAGSGDADGCVALGGEPEALRDRRGSQLRCSARHH